ncbi:MAG: SURF1 family protein [Burkholderiaceae bacterium]
MKLSLRFCVLTLLAGLAIGLTTALGYWQLSRADEKLALAAAQQQLGQLPALSNAALQGMSDPAQQAMHRTIVLRGQWIADSTVFLDNRQMQGKPGFYVITPLQPEGGGPAVLVQRGWVQRNFVDRSRVPSIATPTGMIEVVGRISALPSKLYDMGQPGAGLIRQNLDFAQFSDETRLSLMRISIQQSGGSEVGLLRDWPKSGLGFEKNQGYALQWFGISALIAVLYFWFQIVRRFFPIHRD